MSEEGLFNTDKGLTSRRDLNLLCQQFIFQQLVYLGDTKLIYLN